MKCVNTFMVLVRIILVRSVSLSSALESFTSSTANSWSPLIFQYVESKCTWVGGWKKSLEDSFASVMTTLWHRANIKRKWWQQMKSKKRGIQEENEACGVLFPSVGFPLFCAKPSPPLLEEVAEVDEEAWNCKKFYTMLWKCNGNLCLALLF